jgi:hypothetical protein
MTIVSCHADQDIMDNVSLHTRVMRYGLELKAYPLPRMHISRADIQFCALIAENDNRMNLAVRMKADWELYKLGRSHLNDYHRVCLSMTCVD